MNRFEVQQVGDETHLELWVDAAELDEFNDHPRGPIRVVSVFVEYAFGGIEHPGLSQRLLDRISEDFGTNGAEPIRLLATATTHDGLPATERLAASIVLASQHDLKTVHALAQLLSVHSRDVLAAGPLVHDNWREVLDIELDSKAGA